ncbi:zinc finger protein ZAT5-like [Abrus precatorius]|uniref:Zinc finger protein ZAT5-like n=1 Tax=Abrus precatorius TaxID=3816 RepID=A0A8B8MI65_ABRPR|nr:zinc finger protein ZAT5-like [Abrus precatorius]
MHVQEELLVVSNDHTQMIIKGKRTKRQRAPSPLRLAMPSTPCSVGGSSTSTSIGLDSATTSPTTTIELRERTEEEEDMANCLILLAQGNHHVAAPTPQRHNNNNNNKSSLLLYQCKTCNRCFPSFQALGGHRASYKKPKQNGSFTEEKQAVTSFVKEEVDHCDPTTSTTLSLQISNRVNLCSSNTATTSSTTKSKVHECSICGAEFSSGQALGGHMRRHRNFVNTSTTKSMSSGNIGGGSHESQEAKKPLKFDLNLPAPKEDQRESKFSFQPRENVIVFSTSSLVDCHY